ncbi:MAG: hypothetical protein II680_14885, partial [Clostridia bacterium]|nr:hypothetical protein [Clostridia bacterium]
IPETVSSLEIFPTLLDFAGAPIPPAADGMTLGEMVRSGGRPFILSECDNRAAVVKDGVKLEINRDGLRGKTYRELYDLKDDPHEFENRYADPRYADTVRTLEGLLEAEPYLMETVFRAPDGADYWLDDGHGAGLAWNGAGKGREGSA